MTGEIRKESAGNWDMKASRDMKVSLPQEMGQALPAGQPSLGPQASLIPIKY